MRRQRKSSDVSTASVIRCVNRVEAPSDSIESPCWMLPLCSLLVQRGVASLTQVEAALARQAEHGEDLVTNLLEVATLDEAKLVEVIADCEGMHAAAPGALVVPDHSVIGTVPVAMASSVPFLPQQRRNNAHVVAVAAPLPKGIDREISFALGTRLEPRMTSRSRVLQGLAAAYGIPLPRRHQRIVARLDGHDDPCPSIAPQPVVKSLLSPLPSRGPVPATSTQSSCGWIEPRRTPTQPSSSRSIRPPSMPPRQRDPFELVAARASLLKASTNAEVVAVFFDFAKQFFEYTALFIVRNELAEGLAAAGPGAGRERIRGVGVPLDVPSVLSRARDGNCLVHDVPSEEGVDAALRQDLQRPMRARVLTVALSVRKRVVALLYADDGRVDVDLHLASDVLALVPVVGTALEGLILRRKRKETGLLGTESAIPRWAQDP